MNEICQLAETKLTYKPKPMDLGFIVMCFDNDPHKPITTLDSITRWYGDVKTVITTNEDFKTNHPKAKVGKKSITSLINVGMLHAPAEWNVVVFAGVRIKERLDQRYSIFMESRRDIFYPLIWGHNSFLDASINGLCIHKETFKEVGKFADDNPLEICKLMWFCKAEDIGCKFKAIAGCRMC